MPNPAMDQKSAGAVTAANLEANPKTALQKLATSTCLSIAKLQSHAM
jgi:hypothetical protein